MKLRSRLRHWTSDWPLPSARVEGNHVCWSFWLLRCHARFHNQIQTCLSGAVWRSQSGRFGHGNVCLPCEMRRGLRPLSYVYLVVQHVVEVDWAHARLIASQAEA